MLSYAFGAGNPTAAGPRAGKPYSGETASHSRFLLLQIGGCEKEKKGGVVYVWAFLSICELPQLDWHGVPMFVCPHGG